MIKIQNWTSVFSAKLSKIRNGQPEAVARAIARQSILLQAVLGVALATGSVGAQAATFEVTFEAPGVRATNQVTLCPEFGAGTCTVGVETFDARPVAARQTFTTTYNTAGTISGTYSNVEVVPASVFGGADSNNYAVTYTPGGYQVSLSTTLASGINYFGYWLSALDQGNTVGFFNGATQVFQFTPADLLRLVGRCPDTSNAYCSNPTPGFRGEVSNESFAFVNFFDRDGTFDRIVFAENPSGGGYESDNHTVGFVTGSSGVSVTPVPEPASLTLLSLGLAGMVLMRHRTRSGVQPHRMVQVK